MGKCSKCGGETIRGEAYVEVTIYADNYKMGGMIPQMPGMDLGNIVGTKEKKIKWREKTGKKTGFLIKSDEIRTTAVTGRRCLECGYIEFYIQD